MNRIYVDNTIKEYAEQYEKAYSAFDIEIELKALSKKISDPKNKNSNFCEYIKYIDKVISDHKKYDLLTISPLQMKKLIKTYKFIDGKQLKKSFVYGYYQEGKKKGRPRIKKFWELIVDALHYDDVRPIMIPILDKMCIKACVCCNTQYALPLEHKVGYELDHFYPKSKYPFLCSSFFNLMPTCPACNHIKRTSTSEFNLYVSNSWKKSITPFHILAFPQPNFDEKTDQKEIITVRLVASDTSNKQLCRFTKNHEQLFHINETYSLLCDIVEETMWRCKCYNEVYNNIYRHNFPSMYSEDNLHRFIFGTYSDDINIHKRPLTKLIQDVVKDYGLMM